jgi:hypothetical protein
MYAGYDNDNDNDNDNGVTTINIRRVKKEEEEETTVSEINMHHGDDDNKNNMNSTTNCDNLNRGQVQAVKKEEVIDDGRNNETSATEESSDDNYYDDWKNGNWCWLLSANDNANSNSNANANANADADAKTRQSMIAINCATHSVNSENSDSNNNITSATTTTTTTTTVAITSTSTTKNRSYDDDDDIDNIKDDDENKPPPKKRMRHCHQPINDNVKEEEGDDEEDSVYDANNTTTTENDNDNDNDSIINNDNDNDNDSYNECDEGGYESWTEGNWCLLLPFPAALDEIIETGPTTRRDNADNNDGDVSSAKSKSGKSTIITYTKLQNERWDEMFRLLAAYKIQHGSTLVPKYYPEDPQLGRWIRKQRTRLKEGRLGNSRVKRLDTIGFIWKIIDLVPWMEMYQRLVAYKKKHKSTNVPKKYQADPRLGNWVHTQRTSYSKKELSTDRINHLESIDFVWDLYDIKWMEMYSKLVEYKKENKSTVVPYRCTKDPSLGLWASVQRFVNNQGKLSEKALETSEFRQFCLVSKEGFPTTIKK